MKPQRILEIALFLALFAAVVLGEMGHRPAASWLAGIVFVIALGYSTVARYRRWLDRKSAAAKVQN